MTTHGPWVSREPSTSCSNSRTGIATRSIWVHLERYLRRAPNSAPANSLYPIRRLAFGVRNGLLGLSILIGNLVSFSLEVSIVVLGRAYPEGDRRLASQGSNPHAR